MFGIEYGTACQPQPMRVPPSLIGGLALVLAGAVMTFRQQRREDAPEVFRGSERQAVRLELTEAQRADQLVDVVSLIRRSGWEPALEDLDIPENWTPPSEWEPPAGWEPPEWWPTK